MAKGATAKINVTKKIIEAFGSDFVTEQDKKLYVWADDGGERVQIAISMTCPKAPVGAMNVTSSAGGLDFENMGIEEHAKNLSKSKAFKGFAVVANVLIAAGIMGVIQPKLTIWLRKKLFGTNENPAIAQQEKNAKINA